MAPTTSTRWAVLAHIIRLLTNHPSMSGVQVTPGWPGDRNVKAEQVWAEEVTGTQQIPVMTGGRKTRDDTFEVPLFIRVQGRNSLDATMERVIEICASIEDVLAEDPTLGDWDSVVSAEITESRQACGSTPEGHIGFAEVVIEFHTRLL